MKMPKPVMIGNQKGFALIAAYLVITSLMIMSGVFLARTVSEKAFSENQRNNIYALYVAESGVDTGLRWIKTRGSAPNPASWGDLLVRSMTRNYAASPGQNRPAGATEIRIYADINNQTSDLNRYKVFALGTVGSTARQVIKEVQEESFAKYSYFSDDEHALVWRWWGAFETPVWFTTGSLLEGPVHTNGHYHISGDPIFDGPVTSQGGFIDYMHGGPPSDNPDFRQGITLGVPGIATANLNANALRNASQAASGLQLQGNSTVRLLSDGTMNVTNAARGWNQQNMAIPNNGALFVEGGDLDVSGTLRGRLTAGASGDVVITDHLQYNTNPAPTPLNPNGQPSNDMLGILSENNVIVSNTAPNNLSIFGTMIASNGSFTVEDYWVGPPKGVLTIYGGIIQIRRGPVGTFSAATNQTLSGYDKNYHYDARCRYGAPSWFPKTQEYEILSVTTI